MAEPYSRPATGYPIPASQQPNGSNPYQYATPPPTNLYYYNNQTPLHRTTLLRRMIAAIIVATVLFFTIFFICWLVIRPHRPQFHITSFSVSKLNLSTSSQKLTADWSARFQVYNPNKKLKISYDQIVSSLLYKSEVLSQTRIPPFYQHTKNLTSIDASFSALDTYVDDWVLKDFNAPRPTTIHFNLRLMADVGFRVGGLRARRRLLRVLCDDLTVGLSSTSGSGNFTGGPRECKVYA